MSVVTSTRSRAGRALANLLEQVVDLPLDRPHFDRRIHQARRPDHLLDDHAAGLVQLVRTGRGRDVDQLRHARFPLLEVQRPVVERRRQPEPVVDEHFLARSIAGKHPAHLRHGLMAFVDDDQRVARQVVEQRRRRLAGAAAGQMARVVLDAVAVADLANHLEIEHRALVQPLRFEQLPFALELRAPLDQLRLDGLDRLLQPRARRDEVRLRIHRHAIVAAERLAGQRIERHQLVDLVAEEPDAQRRFLVRRIHLDDVAAHAERAAAELVIVALVLDLDELAQDLVAIHPLAALERQQHAVVRLGRAQAVDARHAGDDDDVAALEERARRRQPHAVDLVVDGRFLLDVGVAGRDVGLRLVVVVVADEVFDRVLREEAAELLEELGGQGLVVRHHQRRPVHVRHDLRHGERLARPGDAEQHLVLVAAIQPLDELRHGVDLVAAKLEVGDELKAIVERGHRVRRNSRSCHAGGQSHHTGSQTRTWRACKCGSGSFELPVRQS